MNIKYDVTKIKSVISDFANITGINAAFLDTNFKYIAEYKYNEPDLCKKIQSYKEGMALCCHSDMKMLLRCQKERKFISHSCHAGITDSVMPLIKDNIISGYIIIGRIRHNNDITVIYNNISWMKESAEDLRDSYLKIAHFDKSQLESISRLLSNLLFANAITVELEPPLCQITEYISQNLTGDLSVSQLCKLFHVSKNMLYKIFASAFDCTVNEYILSKRISCAKSYLENSNKSIAEIGALAGVENSAQFCRMFKKQMGMTPSAYRNKKAYL